MHKSSKGKPLGSLLYVNEEDGEWIHKDVELTETARAPTAALGVTLHYNVGKVRLLSEEIYHQCSGFPGFFPVVKNWGTLPAWIKPLEGKLHAGSSLPAGFLPPCLTSNAQTHKT